MVVTRQMNNRVQGIIFPAFLFLVPRSKERTGRPFQLFSLAGNKIQRTGVSLTSTLQEAVVANGNGKKKKKRIYWIVSVILLVLIGAGVTIAAKSGGTKIDPSKLAKVEKGDLAKSVVATGKV